MESYLSTISPDHCFFIFFLIFNFVFKTTVSIQFQPNFMINMLVIGECRLLRLLAFCTPPPPPNKYSSLNFLLTQDHTGLKMSKHYSYSFHWIPTKLYEAKDYYGGIQTVTFLDNRPSLKKNVTL